MPGKQLTKIRDIKFPIIAPVGPTSIKMRNMLMQGRSVRDVQLHHLPILPEAVSVFVDLASTREWAVTGKPRAVTRAVEWINDARCVDLSSGNVYYGYEQFLRRRSRDYVCVGRTTFLFEKDSPDPQLEYIDPTYLTFKRGMIDRRIPVNPEEVVWDYNTYRKFKHKDIFIDHPIPSGTDGFMAPIAYVLPSAILAWLLREHNSASLDGRRIRDILLVSGINVKDSLEEAIVMVAQMWSGANPSETGTPIVETSNPSGGPLKNLFEWLGISRLPENFNSEQFYDVYVNEIASSLGLALRHFWNNEKTTNRALEVVQEQRQQLKGPSTFVRAEQRMMNRKDGPMSLFSTPRDVTRFGFIEEGDSASRLDNATILEKTTAALAAVAGVFGVTISIEGYLAWMQSLGVLPNELELVSATMPLQTQTSDPSNVNNPGEETQTSDGSNVNKPGQTTQTSDPKPVAIKPKELYIDYDEVSVNSKGEVIDRRVRVFSIEKLISAKVEAATEVIQVKGDDEAFVESIVAANLLIQSVFKAAYPTRKQQIDDWIDHQLIFDRITAHEAVKKCRENVPLNDMEQAVVDQLVTVISSDKAA